MPVVMEEKDPTPVPQELPSDAGDSRGEEAALDDSSSYIPLQRVVVTMQYSKQNNAMVLMEGWMVHYTNRNPVVRGVGWESPLNLNLVAILVMDIVFHVQSAIVVLLHLFCHTAQEVLLEAGHKVSHNVYKQHNNARPPGVLGGLSSLGKKASRGCLAGSE